MTSWSLVLILILGLIVLVTYIPNNSGSLIPSSKPTVDCINSPSTTCKSKIDGNMINCNTSKNYYLSGSAGVQITADITQREDGYCHIEYYGKGSYSDFSIICNVPKSNWGEIPSYLGMFGNNFCSYKAIER